MNHEQELRKLIKQGKKMRHSQSTYFANRKTHNWLKYLDKAKHDEKVFDSMLKHMEIELNQPKLDV